MPTAEVETTCKTPVIEKEIEKLPEKSESTFEEDKVCKEAMKAEESFKTSDEGEKMEKENFPEKENKEETPSVMPENKENAEFDDEVAENKTEGDTTKMAENCKRKSTDGDSSNETQEKEGLPKKRKFT